MKRAPFFLLAFSLSLPALADQALGTLTVRGKRHSGLRQESGA